MCQLMGMNCNVPTDICFSFAGFSRRGGLTDEHRDGFGIAFFEGKGVRTFLDSQATIDSPVADLVRRYPIKSLNTIAHIRKATQGVVALENCHPFVREMWGRYWIFAHNGDLPGFSPESHGRYRPVGTTDSERAFCHLLEKLLLAFPDGEPDADRLLAALKPLVGEVGGYGTFNFLLSNGEWLLARCATHLHYVVRQAPFPAAHLVDEDVTVDFKDLTGPEDRVALIATQPLTDNETWTRMAPGELLLFRDGVPQRVA